MLDADRIKQLVATIPHAPGIYRYYNHLDELIYVGKAIDLRKRVSSYFNKTNHDVKTKRLVSQIADIKIIVTNNEYEALLLENNLIKAHQPRYNILLRDDKTYPYLLITDEPFPRLLKVRNIDNVKGQLFGPYTNFKTWITLLDLSKRLFRLRNCTLQLTEKNIKARKFKVCLEYHIGNCLGPCEGLQTEYEYNEEIDQLRNLIKGKLSTAKRYLNDKMNEAASLYEFEKAQRYKENLESLVSYENKSMITNPTLGDLDVFVIQTDEKSFYINYLRILGGCLNNSYLVDVKRNLNESEVEVLELNLISIRERFKSEASNIITNIDLTLNMPGVTFLTPEIGTKKKLIDLATQNIFYFRQQKALKQTAVKPWERVLSALKTDLNLGKLPIRIECFDNSNIQGTNPVAAMVCFLRGRPAKKEYRHFHVKTVEGPDDFASMREIISRRYSRVIEEGLDKPDLIIIDGGKGQLNAAVEALAQIKYPPTPIIGIAKRLEEIYFPGDMYPLMLPKKSESLKLIQQIRDETHRFAITFHRQTRSKNTFKLELEQVKGLGPKTIEQLYTKFKTLDGIKGATFEELSELLGQKRAQIIIDALNQ